MLSVTVVIEAPNEGIASISMVIVLDGTTTETSSLPPLSLLVHTCTALVNEIIIDLVLVFPLILILVQNNVLMNVSKNTEHNFAGLETLVGQLHSATYSCHDINIA